ncbi:hypothetical protein TALC_01234 [Thermoplasmatales archaeon BRNA1]|nr:hypothetical protein TALC_01234 [Thermoplasmatales archaeon BRNA1]
MNGILVIAYGSSLPYAEAALKAQCERLQNLRSEKVYYASHRANKPLIADTVKQIAADGVDRLLVIPFFIADGEITKDYIPREMGLKSYGDRCLEVDGKKIEIIWGSAIGTDPGIADVIIKRIKDRNGDADTPVLIIGHGSRNKELPEAVEAAAESVRLAGYRNVRVAYNEFNGPYIEDVFPEMVALNEDAIIIVPMFIACGLHLKVEIPEKLGIPDNRGGIVKHNGKSIEVRYTPAVGEDEYVAEVLAKRAAKAFD